MAAKGQSMNTFTKVRAGLASVALIAITVASVATTGILPAAAAIQTTLYVSNSGTGTSCSVSTPCSLDTAKASAASLAPSQTGDIVVQLAGGVYRRTGPITLGPADSGHNGYKVIYQSAPAAQVQVSGAIQVTGWTQLNSTTNLWSATVPAGTASQDLYVNGNRAALTRSSLIPTSQYALNTTSLTSSPTITMSSSLYQSWTRQSAIQVFFNGWDQRTSSCPLTSIAASGSSSVLNVAQPCWKNTLAPEDSLQFPYTGWEATGTQPGSPALPDGLWLENAYELLGTPGQFYFDSAAHTVYYTPRTGESMTTADVEMPIAQQLLAIAGTPGEIQPTDATTSNTTYSGTGWTQYASSAYGDFGDTYAQTSHAGDAATYSFTGTGIDVMSQRYSDEGNIDVYIDGTLQTTITGLNSGSIRLAQQVIYAKSGLAAGAHTLKLVNAGGTTRVDAFAVVPTAITPASNITIQGISFAYTTYLSPLGTSGYPDNQVGTTFTSTTTPNFVDVTHAPGSISIQRANNIAFTSNSVTHVASTGVDLALGTQNSTITGNLIADTAINGINLGDYNDFWIADSARMTSGDIINDNEITSVGQRYADAAGIAGGTLLNVQILHNEISNSPYMGIDIGWGYEWTYSGTDRPTRHGTNYTGGNQIRYNSIHHVGTVIGDGGGIYMETSQGSSSNPTFVTNNYINMPSDVYTASGFRGLYFDGGAAHVAVTNNVISQSANTWSAAGGHTEDLNINSNYAGNSDTFQNNLQFYSNNTFVTDGNWPAAAKTTVAAAGLESAYGALAVASASIGGDQEYGPLSSQVAISYGSGWTPSRSAVNGPLNGDTSSTSTAGASVTFGFTGTGIQIIGSKNPANGSMAVSVDGASATAVSGYSGTYSPRAVIAEVHDLAYGNHSIVLTNGSASNSIDGYVLDGYINDGSPTVSYTGSWSAQTGRGVGDNGDDVHQTSTNGASATLVFYGTGIDITAETAPDQGNISVTVDSAPAVTASTYSASQLPRKTVFSTSSLPLGIHTVTIQKLSGTYFRLDSFELHSSVPGPDMTCTSTTACTTLGNIVN